MVCGIGPGECAGGLIAAVAGIAVGGAGRKQVVAVNVEELKHHIHRELFGARFPKTAKEFDPLKEIMSRKEHQKEMVMLRTVKIMRGHEQPDEAILMMLQEKFFLSKSQAEKILQQANTPSSVEQE